MRAQPRQPRLTAAPIPPNGGNNLALVEEDDDNVLDESHLTRFAVEDEAAETADLANVGALTEDDDDDSADEVDMSFLQLNEDDDSQAEDENLADATDDNSDEEMYDADPLGTAENNADQPTLASEAPFAHMHALPANSVSPTNNDPIAPAVL